MLILGLVSTLLGIVGVILPLMPGTVFLLIAAWAFSRSSIRLHAWLHQHPLLGRTIRDWRQHRIIPPKAKFLAIANMSAGFAYAVIVLGDTWIVPTVVGGTLVPVALWIATRPSRTSAGQAQGTA